MHQKFVSHKVGDGFVRHCGVYSNCPYICAGVMIDRDADSCCVHVMQRSLFSDTMKLSLGYCMLHAA